MLGDLNELHVPNNWEKHYNFAFDSVLCYLGRMKIFIVGGKKKKKKKSVEADTW